MPLPAILAAIPFGVKLAAGIGAGLGLAGAGTTKAFNEVDSDEALKRLRNSSYISNLGMSDAELRGVLDNNYKYVDNKWYNLGGLLGDREVYDVGSALADLARLSQFNEGMPTAPDLDAIRKDSDAVIDDENEDILEMYDEDLKRRESLYKDQLADSNAAYNRNVEQILSNDYQKNAQLLGTMRSEMNRSQRNALEAGASAGIRIAGNINTMLSMQNKQSQQSLETSNNLAQMLLNQQQANAGLRSEYGNYLSQDTANRAALTSGTAERKESMFNQRVDTAYAKHDADMQDWEDRYYSKAGSTNPFAESYRSSLYKSQYNNK